MNFSAVALGLVYGVWYGLMACLFSDMVLQIRDMRWKEEEDQAGLFLLGFGAMAERSFRGKPLLEIVVSSIIGGELVRAGVTKTKRRAIPFAPAFTIGAIVVSLFYLVV
jgi:prepilin signal peptidase PulO-like enzyme (type II secretory pathway)